MWFSWQEYWSGLPFPFPGDLPDPGIEPVLLESSALADVFFTTEPSGKPNYSRVQCFSNRLSAATYSWGHEINVVHWNQHFWMEWNGKYPSTAIICVPVCMRACVCACTCIYTRPCTSCDVKCISYQGLCQNIWTWLLSVLHSHSPIWSTHTLLQKAPWMLICMRLLCRLSTI